MPVSVIYAGDSVIVLFMLVVSGSSISGCFPIVLATIPSETLPRQYIAQAIELVGGIGELAGGFLDPAVASWSADRFGLQAPFIIAGIAAQAGGLIAFFLHETAPARLHKNIPPIENVHFRSANIFC
jgi:MFS family permease